VRRRALVLAVVAALAATGSAAAAKPPTLDSLLKRPGPDVALVLGDSDFAVGTVRVSFLVVRNDGKPVNRKHAHVWVGPLGGRVGAETTATLEKIGVPGASDGADADVSSIYVASFRVKKPGTYRIVAEPDGGKPIQGYQNLVVKAQSSSPQVGSKAYPSQTPTIASAKGKLSQLTTRVPPDTGLLRYSVADSLRAHVPFVLVFATPKFCTSRTCGPVVDVVDAVRKQYEARGVRFIHVEIYRDNDPTKGPNEWVTQWRLPSEPWTFLVGRDGRIKAKFEGSLSVDELAAAVRSKLLRGR
jgi:hypothetical protein